MCSIEREEEAQRIVEELTVEISTLKHALSLTPQ